MMTSSFREWEEIGSGQIGNYSGYVMLVNTAYLDAESDASR